MPFYGRTTQPTVVGTVPAVSGYIFEHLPLAARLEDYEALLPWNVTWKQRALSAVGVCAS